MSQPAPAPRRGGPPGATLLALDGLEVHFRLEKGTVRAVDGVSFSLRRGETLGLVGESGCGKTTVARAIVGLVKPTAGSIRFDGQRARAGPGGRLPAAPAPDADGLPGPVREPQPAHDRGLDRGRAARDPPAARGADLDARVCELLLSLVGLDPSMRRRYPHEFSGGQRQRIGLARALALEPELDPARRARLGPRRLGAGPGPQPARGPEAPPRPHLPVHRPQPGRRAAHVATASRSCTWGASWSWPTATTLYAAPLHPYTEALLSAVPVPDPVVEAPPSPHPAHGRDPEPHVQHRGLPVPLAVPQGLRALRRRGAPAPRAPPRPVGRLPPARERAGSASPRSPSPLERGAPEQSYRDPTPAAPEAIGPYSQGDRRGGPRVHRRPDRPRPGHGRLVGGGDVALRDRAGAQEPRGGAPGRGPGLAARRVRCDVFLADLARLRAP